MSHDKATPRPGDRSLSWGHGGSDVIYTGSGTNRREVCTVAPPTTVHPDRPSFADSQLIAAAPSMLDALKLTLGNLRSLKHNAFRQFDTIDNWIAEVEAAIRLAEGSR